MSSHLTIKNLNVSKANSQILKEVSLCLEKGEIGTLIGRSGCGKTTLLRSIAGFEEVDHGVIKLNDKLLCDSKQIRAIAKRNISMTFQDLALFPHLSAWQNICFSYYALKKKLNSHIKEIDELISKIGLNDYKDAYPHQLSGGQKQRVALLRSLFLDSDLILLDEPFSNQDEELKEILIDVVVEFIRKHNKTILMTTHNQEEALSYSDKIGVLNLGKIEQWGKADEVYHYPKTPFVAQFLGQSKILNIEILNENQINCIFGMINLKQKITPYFNHFQNNQPQILFRSSDFLIHPKGRFKAKIMTKKFLGSFSLFQMEFINSQSKFEKRTLIPVLVNSFNKFEIGDRVNFDINIKKENLYF